MQVTLPSKVCFGSLADTFGDFALGPRCLNHTIGSACVEAATHHDLGAVLPAPMPTTRPT